MRIGSISENKKIEKRISITPDIVKKYISVGIEVALSENYGSHLGIKDEHYKELGVKIFKEESEVLKSSDVIVQLGMLSEENSLKMKENQILIGVLNPYENDENLKSLVTKK